MYFIEKSAIYKHGVFWIGEDEEKGRVECDRLASIDCDSHHEYKLCEFGVLNKNEMPNGERSYYSEYDSHAAEHKVIYVTRGVPAW